MQQVLDAAHALDPPRRGLQALNVLLRFDDATQEHDTVLGIDDDLALRHARAAGQLALDLAGEGHVVERLTAAEAARIERSPRYADRVRFRPPRAPHGAARAAPDPGQRPVSGGVATATAGSGIEEVGKDRPERDAA